MSSKPDSERDSTEVISVPPEPRSEGSLSWRLRGIAKTIRPHQWVKNVFVLAPIVFAKEIFSPLLVFRAIGAFGVFCLLAGAVYTMNDLADVESDRAHPVKRFRPIASGRVPVKIARALVFVLITLALSGAAYGPLRFLAVAVTYFTLNLAYSFKLKHVAYIDVSIIAAGFVLRVMAGGYATRIDVSWYLLACTALLALFLGFGKRRHEVAMASAGKQRAALESYSQRGLDVALVVTAVATVACYVAYTLDAHTRAFFHTDYLWISVVFVVLALWRFLHLVRSRPHAESPTQEILKDGPFVAILLGWVILVFWVVYNLETELMTDAKDTPKDTSDDASLKGTSGPWADLALTLPIFVIYHLGVIFLPVRNAADVVTQELVELANHNLLGYGGLTLAIGVVYVGILAVLGRGHTLHWNRFAFVAAEGVLYAFTMRLAASYVVGRLHLGSGLVDNRFTGAIMALGAGFYEEIAFRVIVFGVGAKLLALTFPLEVPMQKRLVTIGWGIASAAIFSGWHYVGPLADPFELRSFVFRWVCGLAFVVIYAFRGFAPAVWTHALYDVWVMVL